MLIKTSLKTIHTLSETRRATLAAIICLFTIQTGLAWPEDWEGKYEWNPERATSGPVLIVVDLDAQECLIYRNGIEIGKSPVSTGKPGHETPTGVFQILEKDRDHHSSIYNNAPMPYQERLTWGGVALHAGGLPGYPSSHGCIHLPFSLSKKLFELTHLGSTVVITQKGRKIGKGAKPAHELLALEKAAYEHGDIDDGDMSVHWEPEKSKEGPLTVFVSGKHDKVEVFRNGILIGSAPMILKNPNKNLPFSVLMMLDGDERGASPLPGAKSGHEWATLSISEPVDGNEDMVTMLPQLVDLPRPFARRVLKLMEPGSLIVTTPEEVTENTRTEPGFHILASLPAPRASE